MESYGLICFGLDIVIVSGYKLFGLNIYFICGLMEVCVWIFKIGMKVFEVVGIIYIDFECGFIKVEVLVYNDLIEFGILLFVKEKGKVCIEGKEYVV